MKRNISYSLLTKYPDASALYSAMKQLATLDAKPPEFSSKRVPKNVVTQILEDEIWVPSARNIQPIDSVVLTEKRIITKIADICDSLVALQKASLLQIIVGNIDWARKVEAFSSHPYTTAEKGEFLFIYMDGAAFAHAGRLAAAAKGVASIWRYQLDVQARNAIKHLLGIPKSRRLLSIVAMGYTANRKFSPMEAVDQSRISAALRSRLTTRIYDTSFRLAEQPDFQDYLSLLSAAAVLAIDGNDYRILPISDDHTLCAIRNHAEQQTCHRAGFALALLSDLRTLDIQAFYDSFMRDLSRDREYYRRLINYANSSQHKVPPLPDGIRRKTLEGNRFEWAAKQAAFEFKEYEKAIFKKYGSLFADRSANVGRAALNVLLIAHTLQLNTCWISAFHGRDLANEIAARRNEKVSAIIAIGKSKPKYKVPVEQRTHLNSWNKRLRRNKDYFRESKRINEEGAGGEMQDVSGGV